jgi:carbon-monoxide dehydrogenase large subunit
LNEQSGNPLEKTYRAIGQPMRRREDQRLLSGKGRFTDDFTMDGQAYAAMVRSPHPHTRILSIDTAAARSLPGVLGIFTGADCLADGLLPIPHSPLPSTRTDLKLAAPDKGKVFIGPHHLLATDRARHVGEAVAMVVAESKAQALDAAEAVVVDYEPLPWVADAKAASMPGAPPVWDEVPQNVLVDSVFGDHEATDHAFAAADHAVKMEFRVQRVTAAALEPRAALAHYDANTDRYTLHAGSAGAVRQKREIAATLAIAPERLRVLSYDVGGSFGSKNRPYVEFALTLWASRKVGRPVKFTATRSETFLTDYQGRDLVTEVELALRADGRFLAMRASNLSNVGAHCVSLSPLGKGSALITGSYDIPVASLRARAAFTNTMSTNAYRSSGRPEVTFAIERLIDTAAKEMGIDRIALRRKNLIRPKAMPYTNAVGATYDSGEYEAGMDLALQLADRDGFKARRKAAAKRGRLLGLGIANYVESSIGSPRERVEITIRPDGRVTVVIGTQPSGQGHETSFAQVVADLLAVPAESIDVVMGDTDIVSAGGGSHSGRSMRHAATVIAKAAPEMVACGKAVAARLLQTTADAIDFIGGRFASPNSNLTFDFLELAREAERLGADGRLMVAADNEMHDPVFPNGCAVCEVEVDPDTGAVEIMRYVSIDDVGRCINPMIVHGQTHGAIAQGVGQAMWEQCAIDPGSGQPVCGSFMDYGMPRSNTLPSFKTEIVEVLSPTNPLGIKSGGEGGTTPALAVIVSAIVDALSDYGVRDIPMPATPFTVWRTIQEAKDRQSRIASD